MIANYGIEKWFESQRYKCNEEICAEPKLLRCRYRYFDLITSMSLEKFTDEYLVLQKKYHRSRSKAEIVHELVSSGNPSLSSSTPSIKMFIQEAISVLRTVDGSLSLVLTRMQVLAKFFIKHIKYFNLLL